MRLMIDLPHLKLGKAGNAKYRRRVTSEAMKAKIGKAAVEWTLKTRDPVKIVEAWKNAHAKFERLEAEAEGKSISQVEWEMVLEAAVAHGLVSPDAPRIGPVDAELEKGRFRAFTEAILAEGSKLASQQVNAKFANSPPVNPALQLMKAKLWGVERPPIKLCEAVNHYLKEREARSSYSDLEKQVSLVVSGLEASMGQPDPALTSIDREAAHSYRDSLTSRGNSIGTIRRRVTTIKAVLNSADKRFDLGDWRNPFNSMVLPQDDGEAGEDKRLSLSLADIRRIRDKMINVNADVRDIWHLMMFSGLGPNEARGIQWSEVFLNDPTPHFVVQPNHRRRLKKAQRRRRVPLVGTALKMMHERRIAVAEASEDVFPRVRTHNQ